MSETKRETVRVVSAEEASAEIIRRLWDQESPVVLHLEISEMLAPWLDLTRLLHTATKVAERQLREIAESCICPCQDREATRAQVLCVAETLARTIKSCE